MDCTKTNKEELFDKINVERSSLRYGKANPYSNSKYVGEKTISQFESGGMKI
ncbi:MAG: hypothetical protein ACOCTN_02540 [Candidatus Natronoplasma sp.]